MQVRIVQPELMDDPAISFEDHLHALNGLARLNRLTRVAGPFYRRLRRFAADLPRPLRVLDVATGSGDLPLQWARWARRDQVALEITATDISSQAIAIASEKGRAENAAIQWITADLINEPLPRGFDVVTCSLFFHHLSEHEIAVALCAMRDATRENPGPEPGRLLVCDLERSAINRGLVWIGARCVTRSPIVHTDAMLSIRAALTVDEFRHAVINALGQSPQIQRLFPCRFLAEIANPSPSTE